MNPLQGIISEGMLETANGVMKELLSIEVRELRETYRSESVDYTSSTSGSSRFYENTALNSDFVSDDEGVKLDFYITEDALNEVLFVAYSHQKGASTLFVASNQAQVPIKMSLDAFPVLKELDTVMKAFPGKQKVTI
ncbi:hypothetical protein JMA_40130 (plasmid) [Jeotgalibacillus malaysiensis]|uniref:Uncharacterized protein n=1 Tax=Jeotgalibacillus malaysiensis TaxID=1508404 RepID=A0A0B5ATC3_9BACL|nr:hypothetical protein [Jeotgalibacillus malaysiensis]AJD93331.1 hypothetical protein JMA_40130 [Jeotgalibacillus malaysiensis]